jgi:hypothetical protein
MTTSDMTSPEVLASVRELTVEQGKQLLHEYAVKLLNMTGDEFIAAWDEDRIPASDSLRVQQVAALLPFAR